jgi:serine/threonine protein kinase
MTEQILIGRFKVQKQLGKNPGRKTLLALDNQTQELVVVKILTFSEDFEWQSLKLFEREAEVLKSLENPAIPKYLDYFETERGFALVQSYIPAKSLEEHIKDNRNFTEAEVKQIAISLLEILIYLHDRLPPIIHRDIKPSNILLADSGVDNVGKVYLIDFGSVQTAVNVPQGTMTIVGTYGYMPMEQFGGQTAPGSDLYSLGATLIYLVTGRHPTELSQVDGRIAFEQAVKLSFWLDNWLRSMTEPFLHKRPISAKVALESLSNPQAKFWTFKNNSDKANNEKANDEIEHQKKANLVYRWEDEGEKKIIHWEIEE